MNVMFRIGCAALSGLEFGAVCPRALPWAVMFGAFSAFVPRHDAHYKCRGTTFAFPSILLSAVRKGNEKCKPFIQGVSVPKSSTSGPYIEPPVRILKSPLGPPASNPLCQNRSQYEPAHRYRTAAERRPPSAQSQSHRILCRNSGPAPNRPRPGGLSHQLDHPPPLRLRPTRDRTAQFAVPRWFQLPGPSILKGLESFSPA